MFEISQLKEKKLPELQEIAKKLNISKYRSLKKLDLVYQILDHQAANPTTPTPAPKKAEKEYQKPQRKKRERVQRNNDTPPAAQKQNDAPATSQKQIDFKESTENKPEKPKGNPQKKETPKKHESTKNYGL